MIEIIPLIKNVLFFLLLNGLLFYICDKKYILVFILSCISFLWNICAHYVLKFHGSPLCVSELRNIKTALDVAGNYNLVIDKKIILIICIFVFQIVFFTAVRRDKKSSNSVNNKIISTLYAVLLLIYLFVSYLNIDSVEIGWSREDVVKKEGYIRFILSDLYYNLNPFIEPEGYGTSKIVIVEDKKYNQSLGINPDIILILNESFNDLYQIAGIKTDVDYLEDYYDIPNAIYGSSIVSYPGGGTNNSEYELLTSNSMRLLASFAPFNYVDLSQSKSNIVSHLKNEGYETWAFHCCPGSNYSRKTAYNDLGFDHVFFEESGFFTHNSYGKRNWLDSDNYSDMIAEYENASDDPRFMYLLTFQNHGGYDQNPTELDTVHILENYEGLNDKINEYLTSVQMSANALRNLVQYFSNVDRPVIICMVGDHTVPFIEDLLQESDLSSIEKDFTVRTVPFFMWANYSTREMTNYKYSSMVDVVPMILYSAGIRLTNYYTKILEMHDVIPARTCTNYYRDSTGTYGKIEDNEVYNSVVKQYYWAEYNGIVHEKNYIPELFK